MTVAHLAWSVAASCLVAACGGGTPPKGGQGVPAGEGGTESPTEAPVTDVGTSVGAPAWPEIALDVRGLRDADGDGYPLLRDCMDADPTVHPGAFEYAGDGVLNDCGEWTSAGHEEATRVLTARDAYFNFSVDVGYDVHTRRPFPVGDINGDGFQDLGIGTMDEVQDWPQLADLGLNSWYPIGGFFLFLGPIAPQSDPELFLQRTVMEGVAGIRPGKPAGTVLVPLGDLDTDGFDDFLVSATGNTSYSELFLVMGPADVVSLADAPVVFQDDVRGSCLGCQPFATGSDFSGDGIPDVVGAAPHDSRVIGWSGDSLALDGGLWPVYFEIVDLDSEPEPRESRFGQVVNSSCDLTGDGLPELVVGAPRVPLGDPSGPTGKVFVFESPLEGVLTADAAALTLTQGGVPEGVEDSNFGHSVSCGDSDGDGHDDMLVGAPYHASAISDLRQPGAALLFLGPILSSGVDPEVSAVFEGSAIRQQVGTTVSVRTDFDGDGASDIVIGTTFSEVEGDGAGVTGPTNETALFLAPHGGVRTFNRADVVFRPDPLEASGAYIYETIDWTGDGAVDLILGADREWFGIFENPYR